MEGILNGIYTKDRVKKLVWLLHRRFKYVVFWWVDIRVIQEEQRQRLMGWREHAFTNAMGKGQEHNRLEQSVA